MIRKCSALMALAISISLPTAAQASMELAQKNACMACHAVDKKLVGPAYADVAKKCAGLKDAEVTLAANIKNGGMGKWRPVLMPAQSALSEADAQTLAKWILSNK